MLLTMAVFDTEENNRTWMTEKTLLSMRRTVDFTRHHLVVSDNGSCPATHKLYADFGDVISYIIYNGSNIGTAKALNKAWKLRQPGEHVCKIDNDVTWRHPGWADDIEEVFRREPRIGICGLKRKDLAETPYSSVSFYKSQLLMLPHQPGQRWVITIIVEVCHHIMGTCQAYNSLLLEEFGYLYQPGIYGFDDSLAAVRAHLCRRRFREGFLTVFLHGPEIDHIDPGGNAFNTRKEVYAGEQMSQFEAIKAEYTSGRRSPYYDGGDE